MTDWRARVLDCVDAESEAVAPLLAGLVRVPSITGSDAEHDIQSHVARLLAAEGLDLDEWEVAFDDLADTDGFPGAEVPRTSVRGLVGRMHGVGGDGDGASLMLLGHVDVVPPGDLAAWSRPEPFSGLVADGRMFGRGTCDMKGGVAALLVATRALARSRVPLRGDLLVAGVQSEEDGGAGMWAMLERGHRADACVIPEPTSLDVVSACAGALTFRLRVQGLATHASRRTSGVSAIEKFWPVFAALRELETRRNADVDPLMSRWDVAYPLEIGVVAAGDWPSTVPDLLVAEGRLGVALGEPVPAARLDLENAVAEACSRDPWLRDHPVEVEWWGGQFASGRTPLSDPLVAAVHDAHRHATGGTGRDGAGPYGSDLRLAVGAGMPTVHYGPGDAALAHAADESVPLAEVATTARVLALTALEICGVA